MKICIVTYNLDAKNGWGRLSLDIVEGLSTQGHEVTVLQEIPYAGGITIIQRGVGMAVSVLKSLRYIRQADVVHAMDGYPYGLIAWVATRIFRRPLVITLVGTYAVAPLNKPILGRFMRYIYSTTDSLVAISRYTRDQVLEVAPRLNISVINPVLPHKVGPVMGQRESGLVLSVGAVKFRKGYHIALEAFARARSALPDLTYTIIGQYWDNQYWHDLQALITRLGIREVVHFVGSTDARALRDYYARSSLFLLPSVNEDGHFEGFGIVFLEAAAAGLPVIGTLGNGIEDAVKDGYNGLLVPQGDINQTAEAIKKIISEHHMREAMSLAGQQWAQQHHTDNKVDKYLDIYKSLSS